jgi:hypothetical protein
MSDSDTQSTNFDEITPDQPTNPNLVNPIWTEPCITPSPQDEFPELSEPDEPVIYNQDLIKQIQPVGYTQNHLLYERKSMEHGNGSQYEKKIIADIKRQKSNNKIHASFWYIGCCSGILSVILLAIIMSLVITNTQTHLLIISIIEYVLIPLMGCVMAMTFISCVIHHCISCYRKKTIYSLV